MRGFLRRFRMLLPPSGYIVGYVALYLLASLPVILLANRMGAAAVNAPLRRVPILVHFAGVLVYGFYRASAFHPFFRAGYRQWLETTPWAWGKPLPVGPAHLTWADVVIVAAAGLPEWLAGDVSPLPSYSLALGGYLLALSPSFAATGAWGFQFPVLFGLGLAVRLWQGRPESYAAATLVTYLVGLVGLRRSLRAWPWPDAEAMAIDPNKPLAAKGKPAPLGWPFDRLGPRHEPPPRRRDTLGSVLAAGLVGWWCYALVHMLTVPNGLFAVRGMFSYAATFLIVINLAATITGYAPPISLAGRIARLRPLLPSYDQVFLTPIAAAFALSAGPVALEHAGIPADVALATSAGLTLLALWLGGPDRRAWQLTARHRVVSGINSSANKTGEFVQTG